ncbi:MAG TPA: hypothetical protein VK427_01365 [Kofleriaceae bacterium]|nr:hypothetical protein [Kofleriaceae bacterium]
MQTVKPRTSLARSPLLVVLGSLTLVLALSAPYAAAGEWDTAAGMLTGAVAVLAAVAFARWRALRNPDRASTAARVFGGLADERDQQVHLVTLAVVGGVALLLTALAAPVIAIVDIDSHMVIRRLPYVLLGVGALAFAFADRRM